MIGLGMKKNGYKRRGGEKGGILNELVKRN
jgi:hypothetical protein